MADSKHYRVVADLSHGMRTAGGRFGSQSPVPWKLVNLMPDNGLLVAFGGRQKLWGEAWAPEGGFADLYDWSVDAREGIAATCYRIAADGHGRLYVENAYTGEYDGLYDSNDDPAVAASGVTPGVAGFAEYAGYLFVGGIGRPVTDGTSGVTALAPMVLDGYLWRLTGSCSASVTVTLTGDMSGVRLGDRITLTNGSTGAMETRTVVGKGTGTVTVDRAFVHAYSGAACVVAGVNYLGIAPPAAAGSSVVSSYTGGLSIGTYKYKFSYECSGRKVLSDPSPELSVQIGTLASTKVTLGGWVGVTGEPSDIRWGNYQIDKVHVWRTAAGGDVFYPVATLLRNTGVGSFYFPTYYDDTISDAALIGSASDSVIAAEQTAGPAGDMTLQTNPGLPRKVSIKVMDKTAGVDDKRQHQAAYTVYGTLADGSSTTETIALHAICDKQAPVAPGPLSLSRAPVAAHVLNMAVYNSTGGAITSTAVTFTITGKIASGVQTTATMLLTSRSIGAYSENVPFQTSDQWLSIDSIGVDVVQPAGLQYYVTECFPTGESYRATGETAFVTVSRIAFDAAQNAGWVHMAGIGVAEVTAFSYVDRQPAPAVTSLRTYNDRLWGINAHYQGYLQFSSLANPEYWPLLEAVPTETGRLVDGGAVRIGGAGDRITGFVPEVGAYSSQGRTGSALLVFTTRGSSRVFGRDWTDFHTDAAYPVGCIAGGSIVNARGVIMWRSRDGIMSCPAGGSQPVCVSDVIPEFFAPSLAQRAIAAGGHIVDSPVDEDASDVAIFWQGLYIIACGGDGNPMAMAFSPGSGWFGLDYVNGVTGFRVTESEKGYGDLLWCTDSGLFRMSCGVLGGDHTTDGDATGNGTSGEAWKLLLGPVGNLKDSSLVGRLTVKRVVFLVEVGDESTTVALALYPLGGDWNLGLEDPHPLVSDGAGAVTTAKTIAAAPTGKRALRAVEWYPNAVCRYPAIGISGTSGKDFSVKAVQIDLAAVGSDDIA